MQEEGVHPYYDFDHRITREDLQKHFEAVVDVVNDAPGPFMAPVQGKGYGLFADRAYKTGEAVTVYGGTWVGPTVSGPYVIAFSRKRRLDGAYGFLPTEKGRWINDPQTDPAQSQDELTSLENVNLMRHGKEVMFYATRPIDEGEELLWYYGPQYERPWLAAVGSESEAVPSPEPSPKSRTAQALRDPRRIERLPRDVRYLFMRHVIDEVLLDTKEDPCVGVAYLLVLANRFPSMSELLDSDDTIWSMFFRHDFERFGEKAIWWTGSRPMPWRSAYLWTVFFRRRCLRELARFRAVALAGAYEQRFGAVPFGTLGCVTALLVFRRDWEAAMDAQEFMGYTGARDLRGLGQFVHPPPRHGPEEVRVLRGIDTVKDQDVYSNPGAELWQALFHLMFENDLLVDLRNAWHDKLRPNVLHGFARNVLWDYGAAIFAYCWLQLSTTTRGLASGNTVTVDQAPFFKAIFDSLPDVPHLGEKPYLGTKM